MRRKVCNALNIDLGYWWCNEFLTEYPPEKKEDQIIESLTPLLNLLGKYDTRVPLFVLSMVAEEHPEIILSFEDLVRCLDSCLQQRGIYLI